MIKFIRSLANRRGKRESISKPINADIIKVLNPCNDRLQNYLKFYEKKQFSKRQFMGLKNITQSDKMWVAFRLMSKDKIRFAAADIAELTLSNYEKQYPKDFRPRKAIEAARAIPLDAKAADSAASSAYSAARSAYSAAYSAANSAANSASSAANSAYSAANSAANSAAYSAASSAASSAYSAAYSAADSAAVEKKIRTIVLKYWK